MKPRGRADVYFYIFDFLRFFDQETAAVNILSKSPTAGETRVFVNAN